MQVISNSPLIEILNTEDLGERLDPPFYKPELVYLERELLEFPYLHRLEDILEPDSGITGGATPSGANYLEAGIPFLRVQNVRDMRLNLENLVFIDEETHQSLKRSQLSKEDVLLTITGAIGKGKQLLLLLINTQPKEVPLYKRGNRSFRVAWEFRSRYIVMYRLLYFLCQRSYILP